MRLNSIRRDLKAKRRKFRVGRGTGSGIGKTSGRGDKGQKARAGGYHKVGFEGGQMPLQRRVPKSGFHSRRGKLTANIRLGELNKVSGDQIDLNTLKTSGVINRNIKFVKIFASGELAKRAIYLKGVGVSKGAKAAIEALGGKVEDSA